MGDHKSRRQQAANELLNRNIPALCEGITRSFSYIHPDTLSQMTPKECLSELKFVKTVKERGYRHEISEKLDDQEIKDIYDETIHTFLVDVSNRFKIEPSILMERYYKPLCSNGPCRATKPNGQRCSHTAIEFGFCEKHKLISTCNNLKDREISDDTRKQYKNKASAMFGLNMLKGLNLH
jgi:hypothetical protein